jgi:hypothetical protein
MTFNEAEMATSMNVRSLPEEAITLTTSTETTETIGIIEGTYYICKRGRKRGKTLSTEGYNRQINHY